MKRKCVLMVVLGFLILICVAGASAAASNDTSIAGNDGETVLKEEIAADRLNAIEDDGTFKALQNKVNSASSGDTLYLENNYTSESSWLGKDGISINTGNIVIDGKNHSIDAREKSGIFTIHADNVTVKNIIFTNAKHNLNNGGAVYCYGNNICISDCIFLNNYALNRGGAVFLAGNNSCVSGCVFLNNDAGKYGGAIGLIKCNNTRVLNCIFMNNTAEDTGGAIDLAYCNCSVISDCVFMNNSVQYFAGAVNVENSTLTTLSDCIFMNNHARDVAGGICLYNLNDTAIHDCVFVNNSAGDYGGAIILLNNQYSHIYNCMFVNNSAELGSVGLERNNYTYIYSCVFQTNSTSIIFENEENVEGFSKISSNIFLNPQGVCPISFKTANDFADINFNWFGAVDMTPPAINNGNVETWLFLAATANPLTLPVLSSSEVVFKLYLYNSTSKGIYEYNNALLMPIDLMITSQNGKVNANPVKLAEPVRYRAENIGNGRVSATFENVRLTVELNIVQATTKITAASTTATYNKNKNLIVTLTDDKGTAISGEKITININGARTYITDKNGQVKVNIAKLTPKTYKVKITYAKTPNFKDAQSSVKIVVKKAKSKITAKKKTYKADKKIKKYTATLKSAKTPIKRAKLTIKIKGKTYMAKTNKKGKATFKIKNLNKKGTFKAVIKFKENKYYKKAVKKVKITIR